MDVAAPSAALGSGSERTFVPYYLFFLKLYEPNFREPKMNAFCELEKPRIVKSLPEPSSSGLP